MYSGELVTGHILCCFPASVTFSYRVSSYYLFPQFGVWYSRLYQKFAFDTADFALLNFMKCTEGCSFDLLYHNQNTTMVEVLRGDEEIFVVHT